VGIAQFCPLRDPPSARVSCPFFNLDNNTLSSPAEADLRAPHGFVDQLLRFEHVKEIVIEHWMFTGVDEPELARM